MTSVKWAKIDAATAADHDVVAAVAGRRIRVLGVVLSCAGANTVAWKSGSTVVVPAMTLATGVPLVVDRVLPGTYFCETARGEKLVMTLTAANQVSGSLAYVLC